MELHIENDYGRGLIKFWLIENNLGRQKLYNYDGERILESVTESFAPTTIDTKAFLELPMSFGHDLIKLIANYANSNGIKTEKKDFTEGELMATKKHLEDMQKAFNKLLKINE